MKKTVIEHLEEVRKRIISILLFFVIFFFLGVYLAPKIITSLKSIHPNLIVIHPLEIVYVYFNIGLFIALFITTPFILFQLFMFIKPGLTRNEKKFISALLFLGFGLFCLGCLFGYFVLLQLMLWIFNKLTIATGVVSIWSLERYVSFVFATVFLMGLLFEFPIIIILLKKLGFLDYQTVKKSRKYIIIGAFVIAAIITPPDPLTQIIVAIPVIILYEISILVLKILQ